MTGLIASTQALRALIIGNDRLESRQPDIDICSECGEHAEFDEHGSSCCGAGAYDTDPDIDMER